jgi:membrane fusion protein (multidrug efflux system)
MLRPLIIGSALVAVPVAWMLAGGAVPDSVRGAADGFKRQLGLASPAEPVASNDAARKAPSGKGGNQSVAVETAAAIAIETSQDLRAIGSLQSDESVQISSEIAGRVTEIPFGEGGPVKAGDVIVKLDDALAVAEVKDAEARFSLASGNLDRANTLAKSGNVTERARDEATANSETARAAVELSRVRLSKHTIRAPFPGVAGMRKVSPGAYVTAGQPIVNLEKIDTLKIDFTVPELFLADVSNGQTVEILVDALPGRTFIGTVYAIDPHIDVNGRALSIRARLENPELVLRPGLFARIKIKGPTRSNVVVIPESAVVPRGDDKIVFSIENGRAVEAKVRLGQRSNGRVEVLEGVRSDAIVVTAGQQKLKDGSLVDTIASSAPTPERGS